MADVVNLHDRRRHKVAVTVVSDLLTIIARLEADHTWYSGYKKYLPLNGMIAEMNIAKSVLKLHLKRYAAIMEETRGNK